MVFIAVKVKGKPPYLLTILNNSISKTCLLQSFISFLAQQVQYKATSISDPFLSFASFPVRKQAECTNRYKSILRLTPCLCTQYIHNTVGTLCPFSQDQNVTFMPLAHIFPELEVKARLETMQDKS